MKKLIMRLFGIKPEVKVVTKEVVKKYEQPNGSILIEADSISIDDVTMGVE